MMLCLIEIYKKWYNSWLISTRSVFMDPFEADILAILFCAVSFLSRQGSSHGDFSPSKKWSRLAWTRERAMLVWRWESSCDFISTSSIFWSCAERYSAIELIITTSLVSASFDRSTTYFRSLLLLAARPMIQPWMVTLYGSQLQTVEVTLSRVFLKKVFNLFNQIAPIVSQGEKASRHLPFPGCI